MISPPLKLQESKDSPASPHAPFCRCPCPAELGRPNISSVEFKYYGTEEGSAAPFQAVGPWEGDSRLFLLTFAAPVKGVVFLEVNVDGEPMPGSPLVVAVGAVTCAGAVAYPLANGTCACPLGFLSRFDAGLEEPCLPLALVEAAATDADLKAIVPPVVLGTIALLIAITVIASRHARDVAERSWRIRAAELDVSSSQARGGALRSLSHAHGCSRALAASAA